MRKRSPILFPLSLLFIALTLTMTVNAQIPANLANSKASQITDEQLSSFIQKASQAGLSSAQVEAELKRRGLPSAELTILQNRIAGLQNPLVSRPSQKKSAAADTFKQRTNSTSPAEFPEQAETVTVKHKEGLPVFGGDLFSNGQIRFEPDLRMATPASYILGPEDAVNIDLSGLNDKTQQLRVSPEGNIRIDYVGEVFISGMTISEATARIRARMAKVYPNLNGGGTRLSVTLNSIRSIRVMVMGAVDKPAVYTLSSLSTVFHALYACGGPETEGTLRKIELIRGNKVISVIDIYRFLMRGDQSQNIRLQDNDVIRVPFAQNLVAITGQVKRNGWYEILSGEHLDNLLDYAGGFQEGAFKALVKAERYNAREKEVLDIPDSVFKSTTLLPGDHITVGAVLNRYRNQVKITGAVLRPGGYELEKNMTLGRLLEKADGLREDAFRGSVVLYRLLADKRKEVLNVHLDSLLQKQIPDIILRNEDELVVSSIFELESERMVTINGEVRQPGNVMWREGMTVSSLLQMAGGFNEFAAYNNIEIARMLSKVDPQDPTAQLTEKIVIRLDSAALNAPGADIPLRPYDIVNVRLNPYKKKQSLVSIKGEILFPGSYPLLTKTERLSSLYQRSGGKLAEANLVGAKLIRKRENLTSTDSALLRKIILQQRDSSGTLAEQALSEEVQLAINLPMALATPGGPADLLLEPGDELQIPRFDPTVQVTGEVLKPLSTYYEGKSLRAYINAAGGFVRSADRSKVFVVYANGQASSTKKSLLFLRNFPPVTPGSQILVPKQYVKPNRGGTNTIAGAGMLASIMAAIATIVVSLR